MPVKIFKEYYKTFEFVEPQGTLLLNPRIAVVNPKIIVHCDQIELVLNTFIVDLSPAREASREVANIT